MEQQKPMDPKEALMVLDKIGSVFKGSREDHDTIKRALMALANIVNPPAKVTEEKKIEKKA